MKTVYVCSPYAGDTVKNVDNARIFSRYAAISGHLPITPHLLFTQFLDDALTHERALGLEFGIRLLAMSDELWVFGDTISHGMKGEIEYAVAHAIPIRFFSADCNEIIR